MKLYVIVNVFIVVYCVFESDGFKLLKGLKNLLHPTEPTVSTTTGFPTIPSYEKQHGDYRDDSGSWERNTSTSNIKSNHSDEDVSTSQSSENQGGSFSNSKHSYNSVNPEKKKKPSPGDSFHSDTYTTESSNYNSGYGSKAGKNKFTSYDSYNDRELRTTTYVYDQSNNNENYPGQSSFAGGYNNREIKSTTTDSYDFRSQTQPDQTFEGINNQENQSTTEKNYGESDSLNTHENLPSVGGVSIDEILSATPKNVEVSWGSSDIEQSTTEISGGSQDQNLYDQSSAFSNSNNKNSQLTTPRSDNSFNAVNNAPDQSSSFGGGFENDTVSTSTAQYDGSQGQNFDGQSTVFGNSNNKKIASSTPRSYDGPYSFDKPDQPSSIDNVYGDKGEATTSSDNTQHSPDQSPSYNNFNSKVSTTTPTYENTNYNEVKPGLSSGNSYNSGAFESTTSTIQDQSSLQGRPKHKQTSESRPSYHTTSGSNQKKHQDNGDIIFPDDPSLNPTPETERIFGENDPYFKRVKGIENKTPAPVTDEEGRHIIDGPTKTCGPGETFDQHKRACMPLARK